MLDDPSGACPYRKVDWHTQRELNGVEHRLALGRGATGGITRTTAHLIPEREEYDPGFVPRLE